MSTVTAEPTVAADTVATTDVAAPAPDARPTHSPLANGRVAIMLIVTVLIACAVYYFVGVDEGMTSVFGKTLVVHEWVHDARHFLGFPCH